MRRAIALLALALASAACRKEPDFDVRYDQRARGLEGAARAMEREAAVTLSRGEEAQRALAIEPAPVPALPGDAPK